MKKASLRDAEYGPAVTKYFSHQSSEHGAVDLDAINYLFRHDNEQTKQILDKGMLPIYHIGSILKIAGPLIDAVPLNGFSKDDPNIGPTILAYTVGKIIRDGTDKNLELAEYSETVMFTNLVENLVHAYGAEVDPHNLTDKQIKDLMKSANTDLQSLECDKFKYDGDIIDPDVFAFIEDVNAITILGLSAGNLKTRKKAISYLRNREANLISDETNVNQLDMDVTKIIHAIYANKIEMQEVLEIKQEMGSEWRKPIGVALNSLILSLGVKLLSEEHLHKDGLQIANLYCERMRAHRDILNLSGYLDIPDEPKVVIEQEKTELDLPHMELDFEILPPGKMKDIAVEIVAKIKKEGRQATYDPERIQILYNIMNQWGPEKCYSASGHLTKRKTIKIAGEDYPDEYVILVLQEHDQQGNVIAEHAVAESPIVGPNALYICRQDVSPGTWREVFALSKKEARELGARPVKHCEHDGKKAIEVVTDRACTLLAATPQEFQTMEFNKDRFTYKTLGQKIIELTQ